MKAAILQERESRVTPWARLRKHGPCMIFDWHATETDARAAIDASAKTFGDQIRKFQTVAFFPDERLIERAGEMRRDGGRL